MKYSGLLLLLLAAAACQPSAKEAETETPPADTLRYEQETHLKNLKQLTFGGDNAEAYFSFDGQMLSFQATNPEWNIPCDQIFYMPISGYTGDRPQMISTGKGRTTCAFFMPGDTSILYASTHLSADTCPAAPRTLEGKYVWPVFNSFDIFVADLKGNIINRLTNSPGYDAEATLSPDGTKIVFTSDRSGDLELYTMDTDGSNVRQITNELGYDGGAFFSPDGTKLVWRASRPKSAEDVAVYKDLLSKQMVQPTNMEIFVANVDGSDMRQVTHLGKANWAPYFTPSGNKIVFSSNHHSEEGGRPKFNLFAINLDGTGLEQITYDSVFDSFAMFSPDGKNMVFSSNRHNGGTHDTNLFVGEWVE
ncbi:MAG: PD40 domain-containing protein [Lewinellaceae bacterium]|nr:PD40 domain-containing protein [Lewinella sp.]MCB9280145.1 PD40 domain-containing protein [Lewinellaceae bacterium]